MLDSRRENHASPRISLGRRPPRRFRRPIPPAGGGGKWGSFGKRTGGSFRVPSRPYSRSGRRPHMWATGCPTTLPTPVEPWASVYVVVLLAHALHNTQV